MPGGVLFQLPRGQRRADLSLERERHPNVRVMKVLWSPRRRQPRIKRDIKDRGDNGSPVMTIAGENHRSNHEIFVQSNQIIFKNECNQITHFS